MDPTRNTRATRRTSASIDARKLLAYAEERSLLYREMVRLQEQLLEDLTAEVLRPPADLVFVERSMKKAGLLPPQHDV